MDDAQRYRAILDALPGWLGRYGKTLPSEVRVILESPIPADAPSDQEAERDGDAVLGTVASAVRAMAAIPGPIGVSGIG